MSQEFLVNEEVGVFSKNEMYCALQSLGTRLRSMIKQKGFLLLGNKFSFHSAIKQTWVDESPFNLKFILSVVKLNNSGKLNSLVF